MNKSLSEWLTASPTLDRQAPFLPHDTLHFPAYPIKWPELVPLTPHLRHSIITGFHSDPDQFERLLRHLNFQRDKILPDEAYDAIRTVLHDAYSITNDIRWFNEFLWYSGAQSSLMASMITRFADNLDKNGRHSYPHSSPKTAGDLIGLANISSHICPPSIVGLLGSPHHFIGLAKSLRLAGVTPSMFFLPQAQRPLFQKLFAIKPLAWIIFFLNGWRWEYRRLNSVGEAPLASLGTDFAIHRVGMILRKPLIEACGQGILNDHLGPLPWIRGRSSLEFTILHGLPLATTVHWVDEGIDTGPIVATFSYDLETIAPSNIAELKETIVGDFDARMETAITLVSTKKNTTHPNDEKAGIRYFQMHPLLVDYVEELLRHQYL